MPVHVSRGGIKHPVTSLQADAKTVLRFLGRSHMELSVVVCDDAFIQDLNLRWRGKDAPTDVLSFAMTEGGGAHLDPNVLGDVIISVPTARRQAEEIGHALAREMRVLLAHGVLHLCGYDHERPEDAPAMRAKEADVLRALGEDPVGLVERADVAPSSEERA